MKITVADKQPQLARKIGLILLTLYGLGTILGAGIYVLIGKVAGEAGMFAPLAFIVAAGIAAITGLSYSKLVVRYPQSAGEARYVEEGFHRPWLTTTVGYLVVFSGVVSSATLANGFVGYFAAFFQTSSLLVLIVIVLLMGAIALVGIADSLWLTAAMTAIEIMGLIWIIALGGDELVLLPERFPDLFVPKSLGALLGIFSGAFLAFYAFIGFEDLVNVVEEVKRPEANMPRAIIISIVVASTLYMLISIIAILGLPLDILIESEAPLRDLVIRDNPQAGDWIGVISLFAIVNGILIQIIMASRILYGMAVQKRAPSLFSEVSSLTLTPWFSTIFITLTVLVAALWFPLVVLAKATSFGILIIFVLINTTLWILFRRGDVESAGCVTSLPLVGALLCVALLVFQIVSVMA